MFMALKKIRKHSYFFKVYILLFFFDTFKRAFNSTHSRNENNSLQKIFSQFLQMGTALLIVMRWQEHQGQHWVEWSLFRPRGCSMRRGQDSGKGEPA
jgi:hypothetical protein